MFSLEHHDSREKWECPVVNFYLIVYYSTIYKYTPVDESEK